MVAAIIQQLIAESKLSRDDKLGEVLPIVAEQDLVERADEITVEQLLRHTAAVPDGMDAFDVFDFTTYHPPTDLLKASRALPRPGEPGQQPFYSTTHYILLGMIIERVTGHTLPVELTGCIFKPLGMTGTYLITKPSQRIKGPHGHGYFPDTNGVPRDVDRLNPSTYGVQGVISTARDASIFQRAYAQGKLLPQGQALSPPIKPPPGPCGDKLELRSSAGSFPGTTSVTFTTPDGRLQLALAATLSVDNQKANIDFAKAARTILCPGM